MFDPFTGEIDKTVVDYWEKYDLNKYIKANWSSIGESVKGKIFISSNERDDYFLDRAVRVFESTLEQLNNPKADATVEWVPGNGHCNAYKVGAPHMMVLQMIEERLKNMK